MKVLLLSYSTIEYDGRLRELIKIAKELGDTHYISMSLNPTPLEDTHQIYRPRWEKFSYLFFISYCIKMAKLKGPFDIIIADNRKAIFPSMLIKQLFGINTSVLDARELYLMKDMKSISGKIGSLLEKLFNNKFDVLMCANEERAQFMQEYYHLKAKPIVFENLRNLNYINIEEKNIYREKYKGYFPQDMWKIVTTDGCSIERGIDKLVKTIGNLGMKYKLYIIGNASKHDKAKIEAIIQSESYKNIELVGILPEGELKYFVGNCDIGIVNYHMNDINNIYCASGKIYEFIFEEIPVITTENPPLFKICKKYGIGIANNDFASSIGTITNNYKFFKTSVCKAKNLIFDVQYSRKIRTQIVAAIRGMK
ncbi:glycosyltransferase family protein [Cloacibacillus porcorum]